VCGRRRHRGGGRGEVLRQEGEELAGVALIGIERMVGEAALG
jgi:hypothetical protein